jgi:hypothetical protein
MLADHCLFRLLWSAHKGNVQRITTIQSIERWLHVACDLDLCGTFQDVKSRYHWQYIAGVMQTLWNLTMISNFKEEYCWGQTYKALATDFGPLYMFDIVNFGTLGWKLGRLQYPIWENDGVSCEPRSNEIIYIYGYHNRRWILLWGYDDMRWVFTWIPPISIDVWTLTLDIFSYGATKSFRFHNFSL